MSLRVSMSKSNCSVCARVSMLSRQRHGLQMVVFIPFVGYILKLILGYTAFDVIILYIYSNIVKVFVYCLVFVVK